MSRTVVAFLLVVGAALACAPPQTAAVLLQIDSLSPSRPFTATLDWLAPEGAIFRDKVIPENGTFPLADPHLASVYIEKGSHPLGPRRAFVRGRIDAKVFWGTARVDLVEHLRVDATLVISDGMVPLLDRDNDTIPDPIDDCDGKDDRLGCK